MYTVARWYRYLLHGLLVSLFMFLLTLPLLYQTGSSLLVLYTRFGFTLPTLLLGSVLSGAVFWMYGFRRLTNRTIGMFSPEN